MCIARDLYFVQLIGFAVEEQTCFVISDVMESFVTSLLSVSATSCQDDLAFTVVNLHRFHCWSPLVSSPVLVGIVQMITPDLTAIYHCCTGVVLRF